MSGSTRERSGGGHWSVTFHSVRSSLLYRSQLEAYIAEQRGSQHLTTTKNQAELRKINKEINALKRKLTELQVRKAELEKITR